MMAATSRPLPQPVPSPSIQPRRKRTGSDRVSPSARDERGVDLFLVAVVVSLQRWTVSHWEPIRYSRRQVPGMGLARQHDALELGVRQQAVGDDALRQHRPVCRNGMRDGRHGGGLHQRRRMLDRARHPHGARPPGRVGAGVGGGGVGIGGGLIAGPVSTTSSETAPSHGTAASRASMRAWVPGALQAWAQPACRTGRGPDRPGTGAGAMGWRLAAPAR